MYTFIFISQVELGFDINSQPKRCWKFDLLETAVIAIQVRAELYLIYHKIRYNDNDKQDSYTKANESGEEAQKETMRLIDIGLPQSKNKVNSNSKARIESKIQWR